MAKTQTTQNTVQSGERKVKPVETVTVFATGSGRHAAAGEELQVHAALADKLVAAGKATAEAAKQPKTTNEDAK